MYTIIFRFGEVKTLENIKLTQNYKLWYERLGHISKIKFENLKKLVYDNTQIKGIQPDQELCESCIISKQSRLPFAKSKDKSQLNNRPLFIIHSELCGPISPTTVDDKNYFVTFIDDYTHYTLTYLMNLKSEVFKMFKDFVAKSESFHSNLKVVNLYCDNGREYLSNEFKEYCVEKGKMYYLSIPHSPQQNGGSERMIRTLTEMAQ